MDVQKNKWESAQSSPLNSRYQIDAKEITLINGRYQQEILPGSASKISLKVLGEPIYGDLDDDGIEDAALLLSYQSGGSGTFYYVVAALKKAGTFQGSNAVLLGDRIAQPNIVITKGQISAHYKTRQAQQAMSAMPTVAASKLLKMENRQLIDIKPQQTRLNEQDQVALNLGRKVLAVKAALQTPGSTNAMQAITELGHDQRYYVMLRGWLSMQLRADQSIADAKKQDVPEAIQQRIDFIKSAIRRIDLE